MSSRSTRSVRVFASCLVSRTTRFAISSARRTNCAAISSEARPDAPRSASAPKCDSRMESDTTPHRRGLGASKPSRIRRSCSRSSPMPSSLLADAATTGTPSSNDSAARSISIPCFCASSIRFTHTITRSVSSMTCRARIKLRSRLVASHTAITQSASPPEINPAASVSSCDLLTSAYVPGRSTSRISSPLYIQTPCASETVFPGQFPVCCRMPVRALKIVLLPTFGFPANAATGTAFVCRFFVMTRAPRKFPARLPFSAQGRRRAP